MRLGLMASEGGGGHGTFPEYISHHLKNLTNKPYEGMFDFGVIHWDTTFFSVLTGLIVLLVLRSAAKRATPAVPGKFQMGVEMLVEWVQGVRPRRAAFGERSGFFVARHEKRVEARVERSQWMTDSRTCGGQRGAMRCAS